MFTFSPLFPDRFTDFERLFGPRGACAGCWCMFWRLPSAGWLRRRGAGTRRAMRRLVQAGQVPGLLAYAGNRAIGWCAVAQRSNNAFLLGFLLILTE